MWRTSHANSRYVHGTEIDLARTAVLASKVPHSGDQPSSHRYPADIERGDAAARLMLTALHGAPRGELRTGAALVSAGTPA